MLFIVWFLAAVSLLIFVWQLFVWRGEVVLKNERYQNALNSASRRGKPLLIAGGPYGHRKIRHLLKMPAHGGGDVCLDIDRNAVEGHPKAVIASVTDIPFSDKSFGAAFASHLLEHLPNIESAEKALSELGRTADEVFLVSPSKQSISGWMHPDHHLWVWQDGSATFLEQRGNKEPAKEPFIVIPGSGLSLEDEARLVGRQLFSRSARKQAQFVEKVLEVCRKVEGKDILVIHNPGGWGGTPLDELQDWEKSVIHGVCGVLERSGYAYALVQHIRGGRSQMAHLHSTGEQMYFLLTGRWGIADEMAAELCIYARRFPNLKILLIGASQGAAFANVAVSRVSLPQIFSIELGTVFLYLKRRVITERTLTLDSNGKVADPIVNFNLKVTSKAYFTAPYRWLKYRLEGHPRKFANCVNAPGHDYDWKHPGVGMKIEEFLKASFRNKKSEAGL